MNSYVKIFRKVRKFLPLFLNSVSSQ